MSPVAPWGREEEQPKEMGKERASSEVGGEPREEWTSELGRMEMTVPWQEWLPWTDGDRSWTGVGGGAEAIGAGETGHRLSLLWNVHVRDSREVRGHWRGTGVLGRVFFVLFTMGTITVCFDAKENDPKNHSGTNQ